MLNIVQEIYTVNEVEFLKSKEEILKELKKELLRIGATKQADYDLLKKKGQVYSTTICGG